MDQTHFRPIGNLVCVQLAVILYRMEGSREVVYEEKYADIPKGQWYSDAVIWAYLNKIISGYTDSGLYKPANNISRQEMTTILYCYAKNLNLDVSNEAGISNFPDFETVSNYAKQPMKWCVGAKINSGDGQTGE